MSPYTHTAGLGCGLFRQATSKFLVIHTHLTTGSPVHSTIIHCAGFSSKLANSGCTRCLCVCVCDCVGVWLCVYLEPRLKSELNGKIRTSEKQQATELICASYKRLLLNFASNLRCHHIFTFCLGTHLVSFLVSSFPLFLHSACRLGSLSSHSLFFSLAPHPPPSSSSLFSLNFIIQAIKAESVGLGDSSIITTGL